MTRRLFNLSAVASLVFCLATVTLWIVAQRGRVATGNHALRSTYFDKTYQLVAGRSVLVVRWEEIVDQAAGERKVFSTDYSGPGDRTFVFARAPDGTGPFGRPWARQGVVAFPYWSAILATGILPAIWAIRFVGRKRRSRRVNVCGSCGYDVRATPNRCPECGAVPGGEPAAAA